MDLFFFLGGCFVENKLLEIKTVADHKKSHYYTEIYGVAG